MTRGWTSTCWLTVIGLVTGLAVATPRWLLPQPVKRAQIAVADFVLLSDAGPQLAVQDPSEQIALVLFDQRSVAAHPLLPTLDEDLELYAAIVDAGATLVADTRLVANAGDEDLPKLVAFLDAFVALAPPGRLYRDVWTPASWPPERIGKYRPHIAHNLVNMHPVSEGFYDSRIYPLVTLTSDGLYETMPLVLARRLLDLPTAEPADLIDRLKQSGIAGEWQRSLPDTFHLPDPYRSDVAAAAPFDVGDRRIEWQGFASNSVLVPPSGFWINYAGDPARYQRYSYTDVLNGEVADELADKVVFVGYAAEIDPTADTYDVPTAPARGAAAEVAAAALETLLIPRLTRMPPQWAQWGAVVLCAWLAALVAGLLPSLRAALAVVALLACYVTTCVFAYRNGWRVDLVLAPTAILVAAVAGGAFRYAHEVRARRQIVDLFGRYVPRAVVHQLVQLPQAEALALGGVRRDVTVLFADVRGFTTFAEQVPPEQVLSHLNSLLGVMVDCTFAEDGTLDKFIGDAILVLFNAPLDQPDHAARAVRTAWAIQQGLAGHATGLAVGIGIHRGEAVVGRVGTPQRMEYTAVGSTVNVASRLCNAAGPGQ
ncbi:MAG: CHASE2 domain-containing protein, partial [Planctomycetales bacterium]|nr:CHASE2 domain-containing protein [Planctomycetales bacterium]